MTNAAKHNAGGTPDTAGSPRPIRDLNFETPDEDSMQFLEEQWLRFCRRAGLEGEVPDIRAILAEKAARAQVVSKRRRHWLVRPFVAVYDWFNEFH